MRLLFKREFHEPIRSGRKAQTIRIWKRCNITPGQVLDAGKLGRVRVKSVETLKLDYLTDADARDEGMECLDDLNDAIKKIYKLESLNGINGYRIKFEYMK